MNPPETSPEIKIMIVDDDQNILDGFRRILSRHFTIALCSDPMAALAKVDAEGPFAVVVSDMHMPVIDGINFLAKVREKSPDSVRIMLTGDADVRVAIDAVNEGRIFRFLTKPCDYKAFANSLLTGIQQYRLVTAEKELLEKTLSGSIAMLTEILSLSDPKLFGQASKLREMARYLAPKLEIENVIDLELAALLSPIGWVPIPSELREKVRSGTPLSQEERAVVSRVPIVGQSLISRIPRLERVSELMLLMQCDAQQAEAHTAAKKEPELLPAAKLLRIISDLTQIEESGVPLPSALEIMRCKDAVYDQRLLRSVSTLLGQASTPPQDGYYKRLELEVQDLQIGDHLIFNVETLDGRLLASADTLVTPIIKERLVNFQALFGVKRPIFVKRH